VLAHEQDLKGVTVSVSDLKGPGGGTIPASMIGLNLVDFIKTARPSYEVEYVGWWPDPLMPLAPFDLARGAIKPVWVTVHTPEKIPAGVYRGSVSIKPANAPETTVPLEVRVWDFDLPTKPHMKTAFAFAEGELGAWYKKRVTPEQRREWYAFLLDRRISPTQIYSSTPVPEFEDMQFCVDRGLNAFTLACTWAKEGEGLREFLDTLHGYEKPLKEKGWWDMAYIYGFDELGPTRFAELNSTYGAIKKEFPDLPTMATIIPCDNLKGSVDIWVPLTSNYDPEWCNKFVKDGDQVWWYVCCHPVHPYPNFFVDYPAIDPRILFWMNWKYQVPGVLYYMMNLWGSNREPEGTGSERPDDPEWTKAIAEGKRWPEIGWNSYTCARFNGDGHLLYPGPGGHPVSSIRLEAIRDGIDDYEYLWQLDSLVKKLQGSPKADRVLLVKAKKLLAIGDDVVKSTSEYTLDPNVLLNTRARIAQTIEAMAKQ
jgi:hypothetical protein